jgi:hypothetical protein
MKTTQMMRRFPITIASAMMLALTALISSGAIAADPAGKCGYYRNSAGQEVPRPCGNWRNDPTPPSGATAECRDVELGQALARPRHLLASRGRRKRAARGEGRYSGVDGIKAP